MIVRTVKIPDNAPSLNQLADKKNKYHRLLVIIDWLLSLVWDFIEPLFSAAMATRHPKSAKRGRHSPPSPVLFRLLLLRRLFNWSYEDTELHAREAFYARFCLLFSRAPPSASSLCRWNQVIDFDTLAAINDWLVASAKLLGVSRLRKFRLDTTVVSAAIHYPTDASLLVDGVRVISRLCLRLRGLPEQKRELFGKANLRSRSRSAKGSSLRFSRTLRRKGERAKKEQKELALKLVKIQKRSLRQAKNVIAIANTFEEEEYSCKLVQQVKAKLSFFVPRIETCLRVAEKQLVKGQKVPSAQKRVSLFMDDVAIIRRGKRNANVEFGRKVLLVEASPGIIVDFAVPKGNPADNTLFSAALSHIKEIAGTGVSITTDTGFFSAENEAEATFARDGPYEIKEKANRLYIKKKGKASVSRLAFEHSRCFKKAYRFRAGIEGRISVLERRHSFQHCRDTSNEAIPRWVGWSVVSHNLQKMAEILGEIPKKEPSHYQKRLAQRVG